MIKLVRSFTCFGAVTVLIAACGTEPECSGEWCGTLIVAQGADAETLFPPTIQGSNAITDLIFLRLADLGEGMNTVGDEGFVPQLASSWSRLDSLRVRFSLDQRASWHDGEPVTARDVVFTFAVYSDTAISSPMASNIDKITEVIEVDELTVEFRFSTVYPEQLFDAVYHMRILPSHHLDSIVMADLPGHPASRDPVGSGPYRLARWVPDQFLELHADTSFFLGRAGMRRANPGIADNGWLPRHPGLRRGRYCRHGRDHQRRGGGVSEHHPGRPLARTLHARGRTSPGDRRRRPLSRL